MKKSKEDNKEIEVVCDLDLKRYSGTWYEIGRLPMRSERDLENVTAVYNIDKDGKIEVINSGYKNGKKSGISGTAWVRDDKCTGGLYVRFFWPFKAEYNVIKIDKGYKFAIVMGDTKDSMWILNRTPHMDDETYSEIIDFLNDKDFDIKNIINAKQDIS